MKKLALVVIASALSVPASAQDSGNYYGYGYYSYYPGYYSTYSYGNYDSGDYGYGTSTTGYDYGGSGSTPTGPAGIEGYSDIPTTDLGAVPGDSDEVDYGFGREEGGCSAANVVGGWSALVVLGLITGWLRVRHTEARRDG